MVSVNAAHVVGASWRPSRRAKHHVTGGALDESHDRGPRVPADDQIAFPMSRDSAVFDLGGPFARC